MRIDEDGAAQGVVAAAIEQKDAETVEHRLAGVQPYGRGAVFGTANRQAAPRFRRIGFGRVENGIASARSRRREVENSVGVAFDPEVEQGSSGLDETADVSGQ